MRVGAVYSCIRIIAEDIAKLPLLLFRRTKNGKERATDHPLYSLLHDAPNDWQTSYEWREMMAGHLELRGNAYCWIVRVGNEIRELIPIHPDHVEVKQDDRYRVTYKVQKHSREVTSRDILHLRGLSSDGFSGMSTLTAAREAVGLAIATERHGARLFANGAKASGIATHQGTLSDPAADRLKKSIEDSISGDNLHRVLLLEEGLQWTQLSMTSEDSQFIETRKFQLSEIARFWRIPPHKIGDLERATFSNIEHQDIEYGKDSLLPRLTRMEQRYNLGLLAQLERKEFFFGHLMDAQLRGDTKTRYEAYDRAIRAGFMSPNEAREKENWNTVDGLDEYRREANTEKVGSEAERDPAA